MLLRNELLFINAFLNSIPPAPEAQPEIFTRLMDPNQKIAAEEAASGIVFETVDDEVMEEE
jgi:hypothetical protein